MNYLFNSFISIFFFLPIMQDVDRVTYNTIVKKPNPITDLSQNRGYTDLSISHPGSIWNSGARNPPVTPNEPPGRKIQNMLGCNLFDTPPLSPILQSGAGTSVVVFGIEASVQSEITHPWQPPLRLNEITNIRLHDNGPRVLLPRST